LNKEYNALLMRLVHSVQLSVESAARMNPFMNCLLSIWVQERITLNHLPKAKYYGRKAWGRSTQSLRMRGDMGEESKYTTEVLAKDMEMMFDDVLGSSVGKIFVM